jgi:hypothetical protein
MFTGLGKNKLTSLKEEDTSKKHLGKIKNMLRELNMILTITATSATKLRKTSNLLLLMRLRKLKKNLKVRRSSKEMIVMILKMKKSSSSQYSIQDNVTPAETQPVVKYCRIIRDNN